MYACAFSVVFQCPFVTNPMPKTIYVEMKLDLYWINQMLPFEVFIYVRVKVLAEWNFTFILFSEYIGK